MRDVALVILNSLRIKCHIKRVICNDALAVCAECKNVRGDDAQCEMWANRGNCTTDKAWMLANCLKACTKCEVTAPGEHYP